MGDDQKISSTPPPPYTVEPAPQAVFYGPRDTIEVITLADEASIQPHLHAVVYANATPYGRLPMNVKCSHCKENITTKIVYQSGALTWMAFALCFLLGFVLLVPWCLCWIPFVTQGTRTAVHVCPKCNQQLAAVAAG